MEIKNIHKKYGKNPILNGINLKANPGECIGILGGNGSGKSTLLSILAGVLSSDCGIFSFEGSNLLKDSSKRTKYMGYVPQNPPLFEELSAKDNLSLWYDKKDMQAKLSGGVLAMLGIDSFLKIPVNKMSGGMKKRLSIGCSVAHNPRILLLDEPSAALDLVCKERIATYLTEFKSHGGIILLATHDIQEFTLCDKLYILKNGILNPYEFDGNVHHLAGSL